MTSFAALDFETADHGADSACAIGLSVVRDGIREDTVYRLIRPPRRKMMFTHIHGIHWSDVAEAPLFPEVWRDIEPCLEDVDFLAAHNASFDSRVLQGCCAAYDMEDPTTPFVCTVQLARKLWDIRPTKLPDVCRYLAISLDHHHAASDAEACAQIVIAALEDGWTPTDKDLRTP